MNPHLRNAIRRLLEREPALALLAGRVNDLGGALLRWEAGEIFESDLPHGSLDSEPRAAIEIEGETDGAFLDKLVTFDPSIHSFVRIGLHASAEAGGAIAPALPGGLRGRAAFDAAGAVTVSNWFRHPNEERALAAVHEDLDSFLLPAGIPSNPFRSSDGDPVHYLHVAGRGSVRISGTISWRRSLVQLGSVNAEALDLAEPMIGARVETRARWSSELEGDFDLLVSSAGGARIKARLALSRTSRRSAAFDAAAEVAIEGPAAFAEALAETAAAPLAAFFESLDDSLEPLSNLRRLIRDAAAGELDDALREEPVTAAIREWLSKIGIDVDLKRQLRDLLADLFDEATASRVDRIEEETDALIEPLREVVIRWRALVRRVRADIDEALRVRVGIELSRSRREVTEHEALLEATFDPNELPAAWEAICRGDWTVPMQLAEDGAAIEIEGAFRDEGLLEISSSLSVTILGRELGVGSILRQEWESEISPTGDIRIGTTGSLETWSRNWRSMHSLKVLADARLLLALASIGVPERELEIEWSLELRPTPASLLDWEARLIRAGALAERTGMERDLALPAGGNHPYGTIVMSAALRLDDAAIGSFAAFTPAAAGRLFASALADDYPAPDSLTARGKKGIPLFARPDLLRKVRNAEINEALESLVIADGAGSVRVPRSHVPPTLFLARLVLLFSDLMAELRRVSRRPYDRTSPDSALRDLQKSQRKLLSKMQALVTAGELQRSHLGIVFFRAIREMSGVPASVVVLRKTDSQRFTYR